MSPTYRDYYDLNPDAGNSPGDVWRDVPTFGLLPASHTSAIVITPACDLANRKVETITYLPIVPISFWFRTIAFLPEFRRCFDGQWKFTNVGAFDWAEGFRLPRLESVLSARALVEERLIAVKPEKERQHLTRSLEGLTLLEAFIKRTPLDNFWATLNRFLASSFDDILRKMCQNNYRTDLFFLPSDKQSPNWSAITEPSVVLFRYPITVPIDVFEAAQDLSITDWTTYANDLSSQCSLATFFAHCKPLKSCSLRPPFLSDLIVRYISLNVRLGTPDFSDAAIDGFVAACQPRPVHVP